MASDVGRMTDARLMEELRARHEPTEIPPCRVCGEPLSLQSIGGGRPTRWGCSGLNDNGQFVEGRRLGDAHYSESVFVDHRHGDPLVLEALRRWQRCREQGGDDAQE